MATTASRPVARRIHASPSAEPTASPSGSRCDTIAKRRPRARCAVISFFIRFSRLVRGFPPLPLVRQLLQHGVHVEALLHGVVEVEAKLRRAPDGDLFR